MEIISTVVGLYNTAMSFVTTNGGDVLKYAGAFYLVAFLFVNITPTKVDNELLDKAKGLVLGLFAKLGIKK